MRAVRRWHQERLTSPNPGRSSNYCRVEICGAHWNVRAGSIRIRIHLGRLVHPFRQSCHALASEISNLNKASASYFAGTTHVALNLAGDAMTFDNLHSDQRRSTQLACRYSRWKSGLIAGFSAAQSGRGIADGVGVISGRFLAYDPRPYSSVRARGMAGKLLGV